MQTALQVGRRLLALQQHQQLQQQGAAALAAARRFAAAPADPNDSHDDFKTVFKGGASSGGGALSAEAQIKQDVESHDVFLYMKGDPSAPQCGFSNMACQVLNHYGVPFGSRNVLADQAIREGVKKFTSWPTIPQVFVKSEFIGGSDILMAMHESGDLEKMLKPFKRSAKQ